MVASVRSGRRTVRPRSCSTAKACGEVTSWIRCRSTYSTAGALTLSGTTTWDCQTFSSRVRGAALIASSRPPHPEAAARGAADMST